MLLACNASFQEAEAERLTWPTQPDPVIIKNDDGGDNEDDDDGINTCNLKRSGTPIMKSEEQF